MFTYKKKIITFLLDILKMSKINCFIENSQKKNIFILQLFMINFKT